MTEKRFRIFYHEHLEMMQYVDNQKEDRWAIWNATETAQKLNELNNENEQLKFENQRLVNKLNRTALELVDDVISQGKASEISEMSYAEFLKYRAKNGKPMELRL